MLTTSYKKIDKSKYTSREEFESNFVKCPLCGYMNKKIYFKRTGTCKGCSKILDVKMRMSYEIYTRNRAYQKK